MAAGRVPNTLPPGPRYIDWPTYEKIRDIVRDNRTEYMRIKTRGAPRDGDLLLYGIA
jgi:hypothetical protein